MNKLRSMIVGALAVAGAWCAQAETPTPNYLTFTAEEAGSKVRLGWSKCDKAEVNTNGNWETYSKNTEVTLANVGDKVQFRAKNIITALQPAQRFRMKGKLAASGSVTSLIDENGGDPQVVLLEKCFYRMFASCTSLTKAPELPALTLTNECYSAMFAGAGITQAPKLPAKVLKKMCYQGMFEACTSLVVNTVAPGKEWKIPATSDTGATDWGKDMFTSTGGTMTGTPDLNTTYYIASAPKETNCITFTASEAFGIKMTKTGTPTAPALEYSTDQLNWTKVTVDSDYAAAPDGDTYKIHFRGTGNKKLSEVDYKYHAFTNTADSAATAIACSGNALTLLDYATVAKGEVPTMEKYAFCCLFNGFAALTAAPALPATTLAQNCYANMFRGCTSLTAAPALPATTLASCCYNAMFMRCASLKKAPALNATKLESSCYLVMFSGCTSLTTLPELPATSLAEECYFTMFSDCTSLVVNKTAPGKEWKLPNATTASDWGNGMFRGTSGDIPSPPELNTTYYVVEPVKIPASVTAPAHATCKVYVGGEEAADGQVWSNRTNKAESPADPVATVVYTADAGYLFTDGSTAVTNRLDTTANPAVDRDPAPTAQEDTFFLTFSAGEPFGMKMWKKGTPTVSPSLEYSTDQLTWKAVTADTGYDAKQDGDTYKIHFRGTGNKTLAEDTSKYHAFTNTADSAATAIACSGNALTLLDYATVAKGEEPTMEDYAFCSLFNGFAALTAAPELPATNLASQCYFVMFKSCTSLTAAPVLPATTLTNSCYNAMFKNCTSLKKVPALNATNLASQCYFEMFRGCTSLTAVPELPATNLAQLCYWSMFSGCKSLMVNKAAPGKAWSIPAKATAAMNWNKDMFAGTIGDFTGGPEIGTVYYVVPTEPIPSSVTAPAHATAAVYTNGVLSADGIVLSNRTATVVYTADAGYSFEDGSTILTNTLDTMVSPAVDANPAPVAEQVYVEATCLVPEYVGGEATNGVARWYTTNVLAKVAKAPKGSGVTWDEEWYVVTKDVTFQNGVTCQGAVNLILADGFTMTAACGVTVRGKGNALAVYGQEAGTGTLKAIGHENGAGIGSLDDVKGANITINGGTVEATGGDYGAGIGGGYEGDGADITINGGTVTAKGGAGGAGIGGGYCGNGANITVNGGTVNTMNAWIPNVEVSGAGIGGGVGGNGSNITINGGNVTADSNVRGTGIGGGSGSSYLSLVAGKGTFITINGGTVIATGSSGGAGIGGGNGGGNGENITINGGEVTASTTVDGAGIGGGWKGQAKNIRITGGTVTASGGEAAGTSAIGNGAECPTAAEGIFMAEGLLVKADGSNPPTTVIENDGTDLAAKLAGKRYATAEPGRFAISATVVSPDAAATNRVEAPETGIAGKDIAVKAAPAEFYQFGGWAGECGGEPVAFADATAAETTFAMPMGEVVLTATFALDETFRDGRLAEVTNAFAAARADVNALSDLSPAEKAAIVAQLDEAERTAKDEIAAAKVPAAVFLAVEKAMEAIGAAYDVAERTAERVVRFGGNAMTVTEGEAFELLVYGGSTNRATAVTLSLVKNTYAKTVRAFVGGRRVSFPATLNWAKGDREPIAVTLQTVKSSRIDPDTFFTLQLGSEAAVAMGPIDVCTVTVQDAVAPGGEGVGYVRGLAWPANGGRVSGAGYLRKATSKVTLKAKANKWATFAGWYPACTNDASRIDLESDPISLEKELKVAEAGTYFAYFADVLPVAAVVEPDAAAEGAKGVADEDGVFRLTVGVRAALPVGIEDESGKGRLAAQSLPPGLKYDAKAGMIAGVATKACEKAVRIVAKNAAGKQTVSYLFVVDALPENAVGTWNGVVCAAEGDGAGFGSVQFSATSAGSLSAKVTTRLTGTRSFKAKGYELIDENTYGVVMATKKGEAFAATLSLTNGWTEAQLFGAATGGKFAENGEACVFGAVRNAFGKTAGEPEALAILNAFKGKYADALYADGIEAGTVEFKVQDGGTVAVKARSANGTYSATCAGAFRVTPERGGAVQAAVRKGKCLWSCDALLDAATGAAEGDAWDYDAAGEVMREAIGRPQPE